MAEADYRFTSGELGSLREAIIAARCELLQACMPSGVEGGGSDGWWDNYTEHTNADGSTWKHWAGSRYEAGATAGEFSVTTDTSARTVTVVFVVAITQEATGQTYDNSKCKACNPPAD